MALEALAGLAEEWGYLAIIGGTLLEGETVVIAGGTMAYHGALWLPFVIVCAFVGTMIADTAWFFAGRKFGKPLLNKSPKWTARTERISTLIARYGVFFILGYRFIYGIRTITPAFLGATGYPPAKYFLLDIISVAVWSTLFSVIGWYIGAGLVSVLNRPGDILEIAAVCVVASMLIWGVTHNMGKRKRAKQAAASATSDQSAR